MKNSCRMRKGNSANAGAQIYPPNPHPIRPNLELQFCEEDHELRLPLHRMTPFYPGIRKRLEHPLTRHAKKERLVGGGEIAAVGAFEADEMIATFNQLHGPVDFV
nr:hypothetical protein Iba_scaffold19647CG0010 [Ipomoea batatas]GME19646.1 hypothetical protein Iba_scaffold23434CG0010 [Ipomoea batatas]